MKTKTFRKLVYPLLAIHISNQRCYRITLPKEIAIKILVKMGFTGQGIRVRRGSRLWKSEYRQE